LQLVEEGCVAFVSQEITAPIIKAEVRSVMWVEYSETTVTQTTSSRCKHPNTWSALTYIHD
jgi:hypothetical protein